jgi:hypothetical protein
MHCDVSKFIVLVRVGHCDYLAWASKSLAVPLPRASPSCLLYYSVASFVVCAHQLKHSLIVNVITANIWVNRSGDDWVGIQGTMVEGEV